MSIIGIDFGTTTCSVAIWNESVKSKPSSIVIGDEKQRDPYLLPTRITLDNEQEMSNFKLAMDELAHGEVVLEKVETSLSDRIFKYDQMNQCLVSLDQGNQYILKVNRYEDLKGGRTYSEKELQEAVEKIFRDLRNRLKNIQADQVVVGLPLSYSDIGRRKIIRALLKAGWVKNERQIILFPEPLAIALRYGLDYKKKGKKRFMVADIGGGTLDMCVVDFESTGNDFHIKVLGQRRCNMAGNNFDRYLMEWLVKKQPRILEKYEVKSAGEIKDTTLWEAVEKCKIELSDKKHSPLVYVNQKLGVKINGTFKRRDLEEALSEGLNIISSEIESLKAAVGEGVRIDEIYLAGGSAAIPAIKECFYKQYPQAQINDQYVGSGILSHCLAFVPHYREVIERLCEYTYGIWDYENREVVTIVTAGTVLTPTSDEIVSERLQLHTVAQDNLAPLLLFSKQQENWRPLYKGNIQGISFNTAEIIPKLDKERGTILVQLKSNQGAIDPNWQEYTDQDTYQPPVVYQGQIVRLRGKPTEYFVQSIRDMGKNKYVPMAAGHLARYVFALKNYKVEGNFSQQGTNDPGLEICRFKESWNGAADLLNLLEYSQFYPVEDIQGSTYTLILPGQEVLISSEVSDAAATPPTHTLDNASTNNHKTYPDDLEVLLQGMTKTLEDMLRHAMEIGRRQGQQEVKQDLIRAYKAYCNAKQQRKPKLIGKNSGFSEQALEEIMESILQVSATWNEPS